MQIVIEIPEETYKTISEWKEPNPKYAAEYMLYGFVKNGKRIEQQPCEDAISRQAVLEYIEGSEAELGHSSENELVCQDIKELPPVTPQSKTGHWVLKRTFPSKLYDEYLKEYKCSECYMEIRCTESQLVNYPFCHCGAKMVESRESELKE